MRPTAPHSLSARWLAACIGALALGAAAQAAQDDLASISLAQPAVFTSPAGDPVPLPAGDYGVSESGESDLALTPASGGDAILVDAELSTHDESLEAPVAVTSTGEGEDVADRHVMLLLADGAMREAVGSDGEVTQRAARLAKRRTLSPLKRKKIVGRKIKGRRALSRIRPAQGKVKPKTSASPKRTPTPKPATSPSSPGGGAPQGESAPPSSDTASAPPAANRCRQDTMDIVHRNIDQSAQQSLIRKMGKGPPGNHDASAMIAAVQDEELAGILLPFRTVVGTRAAKLGKTGAALVPSGQHSTCVTEPAGEPPLIVYRGGLNATQTDRALSDAWQQCGLPTPVPPCAYETVYKPPPKEDEEEDEDGTARLTVTVVFSNGTTASGASVRISGPKRASKNAEFGKVTFTRLPEGDYTVNASASSQGMAYTGSGSAKLFEGGGRSITVKLGGLDKTACDSYQTEIRELERKIAYGGQLEADINAKNEKLDDLRVERETLLYQESQCSGGGTGTYEKPGCYAGFRDRRASVEAKQERVRAERDVLVNRKKYIESQIVEKKKEQKACLSST